MIGHQALELLAGVLAATIGVMQQRIGLAASPDRHHQGIGNKLGGHRGAHRPAHHPPREQIDHGGNVEPALRGPDLGEVGNPSSVGSGGRKGAVKHVRSDGGGLPLTQIGRQPTPARVVTLTSFIVFVGAMTLLNGQLEPKQVASFSTLI